MRIVSSGAILSDCDSGTEMYVTPNSMFRCGNSFMKFYSFAEHKVLSPGKSKIHWWGHQKGKLSTTSSKHTKMPTDRSGCWHSVY